MPTELRELIEQSELTVSEGVIRNVKVCGTTSVNNRIYESATLGKAAGLYEGKPVYVDHPAKGKEREPRSYKDRIGTLQGIGLKEGGLFADKLIVNPEHPNAKQLLWDAANNPKAVGLSHVAQGNTRQANGKTIVESIISVSSVDLVAEPATTRGLYEHQEAPAMDLATLTLDQLKTARPDLIEAVVKPFRDSEGATLAKLTEATTKLATLEEAAAAHAKRAKIDQLLTEAALPDSHKTKPFVDSLYLLEEAQAKALIEDRKAIAGIRKPQALGAASGSTAQPQNVDDFARSLR